MKHIKGTATLLQNVIAAIQNFEPYNLNTLLDNTKTYQDVSLFEFTEILQSKFQVFKDAGDKELLLSSDICNGCKCKEQVFLFTGDYSQKKLALYFEFKGDDIIDIFECTWYGEMTFIDSF